METVEWFHTSTQGIRTVSARRKPTPSYLLHRQSGRARAVWTDQTGIRQQKLLPGSFDSPESRTAFARLQLEIEAAPHLPSDAARRVGVSVNEVLLAFMGWAATHYRTPDGEPTTEIGELKWSIKPVRELYGETPAAEFGPRSLAAIRKDMVRRGWCRSLINRRIERVKRVFKWAASEELVSVTVYQALRTLAGLRKGRTEARESVPVKPVDPEYVLATLPFLPPHLQCMVELQRLTGMRPGEVCQLRLCEVERRGEVWVYRPTQHKSAHLGKTRAIHFGPRAQALIEGFLRGSSPPPEGFAGINMTDDMARLVAADAYQEADRERDAVLLRDLTRPVVLVAECVVDPAQTLFSPSHAREERFRIARKNRKSKLTPSQVNRRKPNPKLVPAAEYTAHTYAHAVRVAAEKANVPHWHPNQLRHLFATEVRKQHGLEAAQVLLGHSRADVTQVYAERNEQLAEAVAAKIG
jgi:integrase